VDLILETVVPQILDPQDLLEVVDLEDNSKKFLNSTNKCNF
jgi:hypothetical protein